MSDSVFRIVAGKNEREEHVFSVIVKRSYVITDAGPLLRRESDHELREIDLYYDDGDPDWSTVEHEYELAPYKVSTDVVVIGKAYAPSGTPVQEMDISVRVGVKTKTLRVRGDRHCLWREGKDPIFTEPEPFAEMEIRYDRAYGGRDERSVSEIPFHYPRNPMGRGVALRNLKETIEGLALPNIEDPDDPLTPERVIIGEPQRWHLQPLPPGLRLAPTDLVPALRPAWLLSRIHRGGHRHRRRAHGTPPPKPHRPGQADEAPDLRGPFQ